MRAICCEEANTAVAEAVASYTQNRHQGKEPIPPYPATQPKDTPACEGSEERGGAGTVVPDTATSYNLTPPSTSDVVVSGPTTYP